MKSYIKIVGPPMVKAIEALQAIAEKSPRTTIKAYYDVTMIPVESTKVVKLISASGHTLGDYDFFFEWARDPTWEDVKDLVSKIDKAFEPLGCKYTITTK
jgi:hypothetical protein